MSVCPLQPTELGFGDICALASLLLLVVCVPVVVCVARKLRPCLSYSRRRDRIHSVLLCSLDRGGGGQYLFIYFINFFVTDRGTRSLCAIHTEEGDRQRPPRPPLCTGRGTAHVGLRPVDSPIPQPRLSDGDSDDSDASLSGEDLNPEHKGKGRGSALNYKQLDQLLPAVVHQSIPCTPSDIASKRAELVESPNSKTLFKEFVKKLKDYEKHGQRDGFPLARLFALEKLASPGAIPDKVLCLVPPGDHVPHLEVAVSLGTLVISAHQVRRDQSGCCFVGRRMQLVPTEFLVRRQQILLSGTWYGGLIPNETQIPCQTQSRRGQLGTWQNLAQQKCAKLCRVI